MLEPAVYRGAMVVEHQVDEKAHLEAQLVQLNEAVLAKLDGLSERDLRRPMTPTGSNLLGIVKHLAGVQAGYFGDVFGLPWPEPMPWMGPDAQINDDMYATSHESTESILGMYERSLAHAKATFEARDLDDVGTLEAGKWADFIVLTHNPYTVNEATLLSTQAEATYLGGRQVWPR